MSWTEERIATLTKMWEGGATASQIADELGGVSRNAVIGKAHRLGLKSRPSPVKANEGKDAGKKEPASAPAAKAKPKPKAPLPKPVASPAPAPAAAPPAAAKPAADAQSQPLPDPRPNMPKIVTVGHGG